MRHALRRRACRGSTGLQRSTAVYRVYRYTGIQRSTVYNGSTVYNPPQHHSLTTPTACSRAPRLRLSLRPKYPPPFLARLNTPLGSRSPTSTSTPPIQKVGRSGNRSVSVPVSSAVVPPRILVTLKGHDIVCSSTFPKK